VQIRCEKCSTLYELDETLIPTGGAPVQCTKCQFVFRAYPPPPAARPAATPAPPTAPLTALPDPLPEERSEGVPGSSEAPPDGSSTPDAMATPRPAPASPAPEAPPGPARSSSALRAPTSGPAPEVKFTRDGRPIRKVPFPEGEATPAASTAPRAPYARGAARVPVPVKRRASPPRWMVPLAVALAVAAAILAWRLLARRVDPSAAQRRSEGRSLPLGEPAGRALAWTLAAPPRGTAGPSAEN
jgi:predicted Zn finger-like uncharacterized protein